MVTYSPQGYRDGGITAPENRISTVFGEGVNTGLNQAGARQTMAIRAAEQRRIEEDRARALEAQRAAAAAAAQNRAYAAAQAALNRPGPGFTEGPDQRPPALSPTYNPATARAVTPSPPLTFGHLGFGADTRGPAIADFRSGTAAAPPVDTRREAVTDFRLGAAAAPPADTRREALTDFRLGAGVSPLRGPSPVSVTGLPPMANTRVFTASNGVRFVYDMTTGEYTWVNPDTGEVAPLTAEQQQQVAYGVSAGVFAEEPVISGSYDEPLIPTAGVFPPLPMWTTGVPTAASPAASPATSPTDNNPPGMLGAMFPGRTPEFWAAFNAGEYGWNDLLAPPPGAIEADNPGGQYGDLWAKGVPLAPGQYNPNPNGATLGEAVSAVGAPARWFGSNLAQSLRTINDAGLRGERAVTSGLEGVFSGLAGNPEASNEWFQRASGELRPTSDAAPAASATPAPLTTRQGRLPDGSSFSAPTVAPAAAPTGVTPAPASTAPAAPQVGLAAPGASAPLTFEPAATTAGAYRLGAASTAMVSLADRIASRPVNSAPEVLDPSFYAQDRMAPNRELAGAMRVREQLVAQAELALQYGKYDDYNTLVGKIGEIDDTIPSFAAMQGLQEAAAGGTQRLSDVWSYVQGNPIRITQVGEDAYQIDIPGYRGRTVDYATLQAETLSMTSDAYNAMQADRNTDLWDSRIRIAEKEAELFTAAQIEEAKLLLTADIAARTGSEVKMKHVTMQTPAGEKTWLYAENASIIFELDPNGPPRMLNGEELAAATTMLTQVVAP